MSGFSLIVDASSFEVHGRQSPTANIWLVLEGEAFPSEGWNDFVVVLLGWWAEALARMLRGRSTAESLHFMDGPYAAEVSSTGERAITVRGLRREGPGFVVASSCTTAAEFGRCVAIRGREVLQLCEELGLSSPDIDALRRVIAELESAVLEERGS